MTDDRLRRVVALLAVAGIGVSGYLTYVHYAGLHPVCGVSHGCETVQTSRYAYLSGIPVALLGLLSYVAVTASAFSRSEPARLIGFGVSLVGFTFSAYLTYRELFTIHAICSWCVSSAVVFTLLAAITSLRCARPPRPVRSSVHRFADQRVGHWVIRGASSEYGRSDRDPRGRHGRDVDRQPPPAALRRSRRDRRR